MSRSTHSSSSHDARVDAAIAEYLAAVDAGAAPSPEEFAAAHPEIAVELRAFFEDHQRAVAWSVRTGDSASASATATERIQAMSPLPQRFGEYELLEELGRGGMGVVYRARQFKLGRDVALKVILSGALATPREVTRFQAEAEAAAQLDHPGIVPVYDVGQWIGRPYFTMALVEGGSLAELLRAGPLPSKEAAAILLSLCRAVQYAHERGIIHRDLKPANVLLDRGLTSVDASDDVYVAASISGRPRIVDFGLSKRTGAVRDLTKSGELIGTPSYMAPEQAAEERFGAVGPTTDLYALGAILYHMLTGRPPFQAETALETLRQIVDAEPPPPRLLNRSVARDMEAICLTCLAKAPQERYRSAELLAEDLAHFLRGEPLRHANQQLFARIRRALTPIPSAQFREWGWALAAMGGVIFLTHLAIYAFEGYWRSPLAAYFLPRSAMFLSLLALFIYFRRRTLLPTNAVERIVWVVWSGYLIAIGVANATRMLLGHAQFEAYAYFSIFAGFGFLVMGALVWAGGYAAALAFLIAAPLQAAFPGTAPLVSGTLWAATLWAFSVHCLRLGSRGCSPR